MEAEVACWALYWGKYAALSAFPTRSKITHQMKDNGETLRVVGRGGNIIIEARTGSEPTSHLYLLD